MDRLFIIAKHGEVEKLVSDIINFSNLDIKEMELIGQKNRDFAEKNFTSRIILDSIIEFLERPIN